MFQVSTQTPTFTAQVFVQLMDEDTVRSFTAIFLRATTQEYDAIKLANESGQLSDLDLCRQRLVGWDGVKTESGQDIPFGVEAMETLLAIDPVPYCIAFAFYTRVLEARTKNLKTPRATGHAAGVETR